MASNGSLIGTFSDGKFAIQGRIQENCLFQLGTFLTDTRHYDPSATVVAAKHLGNGQVLGSIATGGKSLPSVSVGFNAPTATGVWVSGVSAIVGGLFAEWLLGL